MKLNELLKNVAIKEKLNYKNVNVNSITCKSAEVVKGSLYFCLTGFSVDGHDFAQTAFERGARVLVVEKPVSVNAVQIVVENAREAMSNVAKNFYGASVDRLKIVSVVGTTGKTSVCFILSQILSQQGIKNATIGTNGVVFEGKTLNFELTTPDPIALHYIFSKLESVGVKTVVMEASAQAIYLKKMVGITSEIAIFTNLSNEHIDYFKTTENYINTKKSFFKSSVKNVVINADDPQGVNFLQASTGQVHSYGLFNPASTFAIDISTSLKGSSFVVNNSDDIFEIKTKLIGVFNIYNTLAAVSAAKLLKVSTENIVKALENLPEIDGRMNILHMDCNNKVVVDFAHSPAGFTEVLGLLRKLRKGRIITVFGCVGYSDAEKRAQMGKIASQFSDEIIITTDNLLAANFDQVASDIKSKIDPKYENITEIFDRASAIEYGFIKLFKNDTLVILGKGAERVNKINGEEIKHNDTECVNELIAKKYNFASKQCERI